ncbi:MAG: serine/threonine-protein kinase, partial [Kofleriaceae bacterium]
MTGDTELDGRDPAAGNARSGRACWVVRDRGEDRRRWLWRGLPRTRSSDGRVVAIKFLHRSTDDEAVTRFLTEARAVNQISHAGIVEIFGFGTLDDDRHYFVMELLAGQTLGALLEERGSLPIDEALPILRGIALAVDAAHAAGIAHRDLKPDNVFVLPDGRTKLIDFGIAKLVGDDAPPITTTGAMLGSPKYMSPEQCRGSMVGLATDQYSFGALAYHVLVGTPPFAGDALALALHHLNDRPVMPASVSKHVDRMLRALLEKDPAARPQTLAEAVDAMAGGRSRPGRVRRALLFGVAGAVLAGGGVAVLASRPGGDDPAAVPAPLAHPPKLLQLPLELESTVSFATLSLDGKALLYQDETRAWRYDIETASAVGLTGLDGGSEGIAMADGRNTATTYGLARQAWVSIGVPASTPPRRLFAGSRSSPSPDGTRVAGLSLDNWIVVHELATGVTRTLVHATGNVQSRPVWSPDMQTLMWGEIAVKSAGGKSVMHLTRIADGHTEQLAVPELGNVFVPAGYLADGQVVYCTDSAVAA